MTEKNKVVAANTQLEALFTSEAQIVDGLLRERLDPILGLTRESDKIVPKPAFTKLTYRHRILACLLARHAMVRAGVDGASIEADPSKLSQQAMVPLARCREQLSRLRASGSGIVDKNSTGYYVPLANLLVALEELASGTTHQP